MSSSSSSSSNSDSSSSSSEDEKEPTKRKFRNQNKVPTNLKKVKPISELSQKRQIFINCSKIVIVSFDRKYEKAFLTVQEALEFMSQKQPNNITDQFIWEMKIVCNVDWTKSVSVEYSDNRKFICVSSKTKPNEKENTIDLYRLNSKGKLKFVKSMEPTDPICHRR